MEFRIKLTWSKIIATVVLFIAVFLDYTNGGIQAFMYSLPFATFLITGKMLSDYGQNNLNSKQ